MNVEWERGAIMTLEEILAGESKNVEFKENLPEKSIKYMKSVVAFANLVISSKPFNLPELAVRINWIPLDNAPLNIGASNTAFNFVASTKSSHSSTTT